jgi:hypothetical protein
MTAQTKKQYPAAIFIGTKRDDKVYKKTLVIEDDAQISAFHEFIWAKNAQPFLMHALTSSITNRTAEEDFGGIKKLMDKASDATNKMLQLGIFTNKYDFDYNWEEKSTLAYQRAQNKEYTFLHQDDE